LHYGPILKRKDSYFGSTINVTARITSKARAGTFWCSEEFANGLQDRSIFKLEPMGRHSFKNISGEMELMELAHEFEDSFYVDPVCRMLILDKEMAIRHPGEEEVYFCSPSCLEAFKSANAEQKI
jgi:YHS domain-containing protein